MNSQQDLKTFNSFHDVYNKEQSKNIDAEFTRLKGECYLEHAGSSLYSEKQIENIFNDFKTNIYGNPHALSASSKLSEDSVDQIRYRVLQYFNADPDEYSIIFTSGTTASLKLISEQFNYAGTVSGSSVLDKNNHGTFMYLQDNHTSVLGMREYAKNVIPISLETLFETMECEQVSTDSSNKDSETNSLFVYPAQCNFSGTKYPLSWINKIQNGFLNKLLPMQKHSTKWYCMVDAASYVGTSKLDLSAYKPDFVACSFFKMFGYPTGLGALFIKNNSASTLKKVYFGGGTVQIALSTEQFFILRNVLHQKLEDGTIPFLAIVALRHCFDTFDRLGITTRNVTDHVFQIARYIHHNLLTMHHSNGKPIAKLYANTDYEDVAIQGGVVNFNLMRSNGDFVSFTEFLHMSNLYNIHIRTGCFCNPGACQRHLELTNDDCRKHFEAGHICGDQHNIVDGVPTGSVRASFGYMTTKENADTFLQMIRDCFLTKPAIIKFPDDYNETKTKYKLQLLKKSEKLNQNGVEITNKLNAVCSEKTIISSNSKIENTCGEKKFEPTEIELLEMYIYPIKSCGSFSIQDKWYLTNTGLKYDRKWMIVTHTGACLSQKQETKMCLIKPIIRLNENVMELTYPGMGSIVVPLDSPEKITKEVSVCQSKVCKDRVQGIDCGDEISLWLEDALGRQGLRLIRQCENEGRKNHKKEDDTEKLTLSLSNEAQILLINLASIEWLSDKIIDSDLALSNLIRRFRANFVVRGKEAFEEQLYSHLKIGDALLKCDGPCTRCQMICIDQESGLKNIEPLRTLSENCNGKLQFGLYLRLMNDTDNLTISVGQKIKVA